ncbi:MAG: exopolyphosphatase [Cytophagales bacterium]|nr:exopolyphosphatase [Cytophagales bacterium]
MKQGRFAVIDLGTNTFNLLIVEIFHTSKVVLHHDRYVVKIGKGGIQNNVITPEACTRAINAIEYFVQHLNIFKVPSSNIKAIATSAFRNATNGTQLAHDILAKTGINIEIINGDKEAELIYYGVKAAMDIGDEHVLIMDIGGGSVEFIICNSNQILWKKSYEIGAQRLLDMFHDTDPIRLEQIDALYDYLTHHLSDLKHNINIYKPQTMIGSSGTFDTLCEIYSRENELPIDLENDTEYEIPVAYFEKIFRKIIKMNVQERKAIQGMSVMRVDMIVVASCLIDYMLKKFKLKRLKISFYSLKEGVLYLNYN